MDYVVGSGLLLAAVLVLAVGRLILYRRPRTADGEAFGLTESFAFAFTVLLALAISVLARRAFEDASLMSLALLAGALTVTGAAAALAWLLLARLAGGAAAAVGGELPAGPRTPETDRRGRAAGRKGRRATGTRCAA